MKVLMLNGSPKANGNTYTALLEIGRQLEKEGIEYEIVQMGGKPVRDCIGCNKCTENGCVFTDDEVNAFIAKAREADGFVFGTHPFLSGPGLLQQQPRLPVQTRRRRCRSQKGRHLRIL